MATTTTTTNKPLNPRAQDLSPKGYNRAALYSGKALDFDGVNDYVGITSATDLWTGDFSVSWYGNLDAVGNYFAFSSGAYDAIAQAGINMWYSGASALNFSVHFPETDGTGQQGYNLTLAESYEYWHRIDLVFVSSSRLLSLYQNGILVDTATIASNVDTAYMPNGWEFGRSYGGSFPLNGKLTNLKAFNTALTAAQVADLYLNPEKIVPDGVADSALKLWLPMMEGAGTTAYDGSGNGNDGTINGATWTAGIGAPVAQTALVSWNKGVNLMKYSRGQATASTLENWNEGVGNPFTPLSATGIDGQANAAATYTRNPANSIIADYVYYRSVPVVNGTAYKVTGYLKLGTATNAVVVINDTIAWDTIAGANFVATAAAGYSDWKEFSITFTATASNAANIHIGTHQETGVVAQANGTFFIDAFAIRPVTAGDAYIKTNATAQTSDVLVPEGLTAGASIFGTDIITPRNAFALNLDGKSWAEVHDNASVDLAYPATLEIWTYQFGGQLSVNNVYMPLFDKAPTSNGGGGITLRRYSQTQSSGNGYLGIGGSYFMFGSLTYNEWNHIVAVVESGSQKIYVNGALVSTTTNAYTLSVNSEPVRIGYAPSDGVQYFYGSLANPRIYNRALTAAEVLRNYNADKAKFGL